MKLLEKSLTYIFRIVFLLWTCGFFYDIYSNRLKKEVNIECWQLPFEKNILFKYNLTFSEYKKKRANDKKNVSKIDWLGAYERQYQFSYIRGLSKLNHYKLWPGFTVLVNNLHFFLLRWITKSQFEHPLLIDVKMLTTDVNNKRESKKV